MTTASLHPALPPFPEGRAQMLAQLTEAALAKTPARRAGRVALVGAGPGDPGLLTLRALRLLNQADVIVHDRLVSTQVLEIARRDAQLIDVGKRCGGTCASQHDINAQLLALAREGKRVVRLKGGDCLVFGRGGEELEYLRAHGIDYEVVPGVTAALACAAYAGIPLTHRDHAHSVTLVSAQHRDDAAVPFSDSPDAHGTLVVYMGVGALARTRDRLLAQGRDALTPFALVENGSRPGQRVILGHLGDLVERARDASVRSPALLIVGAVAALAERLHWFGAPPIVPEAASLAAAA